LDDGSNLPEEATVNATGAVFSPELIELMKSVLDDATATLPEAKRTSVMKAEIASHILARAAKGERDPAALKMAAPFSRGRVHTLFARNLAGAPGSVSRTASDLSLSRRRIISAACSRVAVLDGGPCACQTSKAPRARVRALRD
jgi:hypothetical protein